MARPAVDRELVAAFTDGLARRVDQHRTKRVVAIRYCLVCEFDGATKESEVVLEDHWLEDTQDLCLGDSPDVTGP